ncbi:proenkephalin-A-like [Scleropages formosus]|uniref:Proenkephalin-A-like n=1 Tax=Scleropages formosus TaxID=113540 RepID=A0A0P7XI75_SCLFO|nr:proenkephalin-A-like [Scleropages formosus]
MAPAASSTRIVVLIACLWLTVRAAQASCGEECARCLHLLRDNAGQMDALICKLECEGRITTTKSVDLCRDVVQGDKGEMLAEGLVTAAGPNRGREEEEENQLAKKYGGFMKRYGGFMKKARELSAASDEVELNRGFTKKYPEGVADHLSILKELLNPEVEDKAEQVGEMTKRYGGFMEKSKRSSVPDDEIKELQKRYGGFMRRVGRPSWKEDEKRYIGFFEAPQGEAGGVDSAGMEKRYGGFMD